MINKFEVLAVVSTIMWNLLCIWLLKRELIKTETIAWIKSKFIIFAIVMLVCNVALVITIGRVYTDHTLLYTLKRVGLLGLLWIIAPIDYKYKRIPNRFLLVGVAFRGVILIGELLFEREFLLGYILSEIIAMAGIIIITFLCNILVKNSLGAGDIKLMLLMAACLDMAGAASSLFCSMLVSFFAAVFLLATKKKERKDTIPFGPCILLGTFISVFLIGA